MIVGTSATLTGIGVAIGMALAAATTRRLATLLFQVSPIDPLTVAAVAGVVTVLGIGAAYVPARRAARMDPVEVMKA